MEELYNWIETVEQDRDWLRQYSDRTLDKSEISGLCWVIIQLGDYSSVYSSNLPKILGVSPSILKRFMESGGVVEKVHALVVADRVLAYLKSMEQRNNDFEEIVFPVVRAAQVRFPAQEWNSVVPTIDNKKKIAEISRLLDEVLANISKSNTFSENCGLSQIEREQLVAILKTALKILEAPMVEKGLLLKAREKLQSAMVKTMEKKAEDAFGILADALIKALSEFIRSIF